MGNDNATNDDRSTTDSAGERNLPDGSLKGSEQKAAADRAESETERDSDEKLQLDGDTTAKTETLYSDGIDVEEEFDTLAGTHGSQGTIP